MLNEELLNDDKALVERYPFLQIGERTYETEELGTWLDDLHPGWKKAFGLQLCEELRDALIDADLLKSYKLLDVKEKYGELRWYDAGGNDETDRIIHKYETISYHTCVICGRTAEVQTTGWIEPYCKKCAKSEWRQREFMTEKLPFYNTYRFGK